MQDAQGKSAAAERKKRFLCKAEGCIEFWDDIIDIYSAFETLSLLREKDEPWRSDCGDDPETFFCEMTHVLKTDGMRTHAGGQRPTG